MIALLEEIPGAAFLKSIYTMEHKASNTPPYFQSARRFFGYALRHNAYDLYQDIDSPLPENLARHTTLHLTTKGFREGVFAAEDILDRQERTLLKNGINDTRRIIQTAFDEHRPPEIAEALAIIKQPETIRTIAHLALREEDALDDLINTQSLRSGWDGNFYWTDRDLAHLERHPKLATDSAAGCPMAGHQGEVAPDPLFSRFIPWAGELAVRSLYLHRYKKDTI